MRHQLHLLPILCALTTGCEAAPAAVDGGSDAGIDAATIDAGPPDGGDVPFELTSSAFTEGATIPLRYECGPPPVADGPGENVSPPLTWTAGPGATLSYAIVVRDRDAGSLVHWVLYDIPAAERDLAEDVPPGYSPSFPVGAHQAQIQGSGYFGYFGPCSPASVNTYEWTLHAMPSATLEGVDSASTEDAIAALIESTSIASASLSGES